MQILNLTPEQNVLVRRYSTDEELYCLCDTANRPFTVILPDVENISDVRISVINTGTNTLSVVPMTGQFVNDIFLVTLKQWDCLRVIADSKNKRWIIVDKKTNRFGSESDYTEFGTDGFITAYGNAMGWDDIIVPIASGKVPAVNYPDWTPFTTNLSAYTFKVNDHIDCSTVEWLHDSLENAIGYVHVHWATNQLEVVDKYVKYRVYYVFAKDGTPFTSESYIESADIIIPANTANKTSFTSNIGTINLSGYGKGTQIKTAFMRVSSTGTAPANAPFVGQIGIHRKIDKPYGSKTIV